MGNVAKTVDEQIVLLRERGMVIDDEEKAKEILFDIGYYRLGFYWFPFEKTYPCKESRNHIFKEGTKLCDVVELYYFDFDLRNLLMRYVNRIEINFRTFLIYHVSNLYKESPTWFVDQKVVKQRYIDHFKNDVYEGILNSNTVIKHHHKIHINDRYAPAWKTIEFMTLGQVISLYLAIESNEVKTKISEHFGIKNPGVFRTYLYALNKVRNNCAHGKELYDLKLPVSIRKGPVAMQSPDDYHNLRGALRVILYLLGSVSENRAQELKNQLFSLFENMQHINKIISNSTGIRNIKIDLDI